MNSAHHYVYPSVMWYAVYSIAYRVSIIKIVNLNQSKTLGLTSSFQEIIEDAKEQVKWHCEEAKG